MWFQINKLSLSSKWKIVPFLVSISKVLPNKTPLAVALSFDTDTRFLVLFGTSNALLNLIFHSEPLESKTLISTVPFPLIKLLLLFAFVMVPEYSLSISMNKLSSLII